VLAGKNNRPAVNKAGRGTGGTAMIRNEVLDAIRARRSTRNFTEQQVEPEQLETLLDAAIWAPSGGNNQSWLFTAIQNKEALLKLNKLVREGFQHWVPDDDYPGKLGAKDASQKESYNFYYHAPTVIIASNKPNYENAMADCALGLENIFLAAQSMGLGSCYLNQLHWLRDDPGVRDFLFELGIPKEHTICSAAAIGTIGKASTPPARKLNTTHIVK
jgi:nitroreductase